MNHTYKTGAALMAVAVALTVAGCSKGPSKPKCSTPRTVVPTVTVNPVVPVHPTKAVKPLEVQAPKPPKPAVPVKPKR